MEEKIILFSKHELLILAAIKGLKEIYGFDLKGDELKQDGALYILQDLSKRNFIKSNEQNFALLGYAKDVFDVIKESETTIEVTKNTGRKSIVYVGEKSVFISPSLTRPDMLEIKLLNSNNIFSFLSEEGWLPSDKNNLSEVL